MEDILSQVTINNNIIGLSIILVILGRALKSSPMIPNYLIIWILMGVSTILSLIVDFSVSGLVEGFIALSLATTYYQTYKQTKIALEDKSSVK
ncbi:MAG: hypothetical protein ACOXZS_04110 [Bacilli bacterium]|jgi:Na+/serine symporter